MGVGGCDSLLTTFVTIKAFGFLEGTLHFAGKMSVKAVAMR
jgi:hypothetical protein